MSALTGRLMARGSVYTASAAVQMVGRLALVPLVTRALAPEDFGLAATCFILTSLGAGIGGLGMPTAIVRQYFEESPTRAREITGLSIAIAVVFAAVLHLTGPSWIRAFGSLRYDPAFAVAVWTLVPTSTTWATQSWFRASGRQRAYVATGLLSTIGGQVIGYGLVLLGDGDLALRYVAGVGLGSTLSALVGVWLVRPRIGLHGHSLRFPALLRLAAPTVPHYLALVLINSGDRFVIQHVLGFAAVGRYQVAYAVGALTIPALDAFVSAWGPLIQALPAEDRRLALAQTSRTVTTIIGVGALAIALVAPVALRVAAPASYDPSGQVFLAVIVAMGAIPFAVQSAITVGLVQQGQTLSLTWAAPVAAAANVGMNLLLVPRLGLEGAGIATFLAYAVMAAVSAASVRRGMFDLPWLQAALWCGALLTAHLLLIRLPDDGLWAVGRVLAGGAIVGAGALWVMRTFRREAADTSAGDALR